MKHKTWNMKHFEILWSWLPAALVAGAIFFLSSQPNLHSPLPSAYDLVIRKIGHIGIFALFAFFTLRALAHGHKLKLRQAAFMALVLATLYAVSDEYHQSFTSGRFGSETDILIDAFGAGLGVLVFLKRGKF